MNNARIISIEWAHLQGQRPRKAGSNARLGEHGTAVGVPLARVTTDDGASGFGVCRITRDLAQSVVGQIWQNLFREGEGVVPAWRILDYPLWDLAGVRAGRPVFALAADIAGRPIPETLRVPCYDTSLYFDDLHLEAESDAAALIAAEAREGYAIGHRAFKIKIGRGARHLELEAGTRRDIAIIRAVREAVGPTPPILLDANNGYNLNLTKCVLQETRDCGIFWMEEAFHEDPILYRDLQDWLRANDLPILIADGEGQADPNLMRWAREGIVNVVQYDIFGHGFSRWLETGRTLDESGARSAPHHYGGHLGNYVTCHLAPALRGFTFTEWDAADTPGIDAPGYELHEGQVTVPNIPGFGLTLDEAAFQQAEHENGFVARA